MGKNHKHQKQLKSEKSKIKLKLKGTKTKFLPKGQNVTDTSFKVRSIAIREQLAGDKSDGPVSKRKLSINELLNRLRHYSSVTRFEGCEGIAEIIMGHGRDASVEQHLSALLQGLCQLMLDRDGKVRRKAIKVLGLLLEKISATKILAFLPILTSHTMCAMTSIDGGVQEDSLLVIDCFINSVPQLIVSSFPKIFANLSSLISSSSQIGRRTLDVHLSGKLTGIKWRIKVLGRLRAILAIITDTKTDTAAANSKRRMLRNGDEANCFPIYNTSYVGTCPVDIFGGRRGCSETVLDEAIVKSVNPLIGLLHEIWTEAAPESKRKNFVDGGVTVLTPEAALVLTGVCEVFSLLWKLVQLNEDGEVEKNRSNVFFTKETQNFQGVLLANFPYRQHERTAKQDREDGKCLQANLSICHIFAVLNRNLSNKLRQAEAGRVVGYINQCLVNRCYVADDHVNLLTLVVCRILFENHSWSQKNVQTAEMLDNLLHFYENMHYYSGKSKSIVFGLLCDIADSSRIKKTNKFGEWLTTLPKLLCAPSISEKVLQTLLHLVRQDNKSFQGALWDNRHDILANATKVRIEDSRNRDQSLLKIASLLYYAKKCDGRNKIDLIADEQNSKIASYVNEMFYRQ